MREGLQTQHFDGIEDPGNLVRDIQSGDMHRGIPWREPRGPRNHAEVGHRARGHHSQHYYREEVQAILVAF